jgi:hypothetical protein
MFLAEKVLMGSNRLCVCEIIDFRVVGDDDSGPEDPEDDMDLECVRTSS